jgi:hypothetical protein
VAAVRFATTRTRTFDADSYSHLPSVPSSDATPTTVARQPDTLLAQPLKAAVVGLWPGCGRRATSYAS